MVPSLTIATLNHQCLTALVREAEDERGGDFEAVLERLETFPLLLLGLFHRYYILLIHPHLLTNTALIRKPYKFAAASI